MYQAPSTPLCAGDGRAGDAPTSSRPLVRRERLRPGGAAFPANGHPPAGPPWPGQTAARAGRI